MGTDAGEAIHACGCCGRGVLRATDAYGMMMEHRDDPCVRIRRHVMLPVCDACGDMRLDEAQTIALDEVLEHAYRHRRLRRQSALINDLCRAGLTHEQIERFAHLPPGCVTRLRRGKLASGTAFRLLYLLHAFRIDALQVLSRIDPVLGAVQLRSEPGTD